MKRFLDEDFLLETATAAQLYHEHAEKMPIFDFHTHIDPKEILENRAYPDLCTAWLARDPYKWRLMRSNGVEERYVTGKDTSGFEKFQKFAEALPRAIGNPMYVWVHLELARAFHIFEPLSGDTAEEIWRQAQIALASPELRPQAVLQAAGVRTLCTTDDPVDDLKTHEALAASAFPVRVLPTFRPDRVLAIEAEDWSNYMAYGLGAAADVEITTMEDVREALRRRLDVFNAHGCRLADHALSYVGYEETEEYELDDIVGRTMHSMQLPTEEEQQKFRSGLLLFLGQEYARRGMTMQIHYGVLRDENTKALARRGPREGFDVISSRDSVGGLIKLLNAMDRLDSLPRTILYAANPADNAILGSMLGAFEGEGVPGKVQQGAAWWFNNSRNGIEAQLASLASLSLLGNAVGTVTDARTMFSFARHEYYRRVLCSFLGGLVERGEYPDDEELLGKMVEDICYGNAVRFLQLDETSQGQDA